MAEPVAGPDWVSVITSLPPVMQGVAIFGVAVGATVILGRRFLKRLLTEQPEPKVLAVGDPTHFTDMGPVRDIVKNLDLLIIQEMKNEVAIASLTGAFQDMAVKLSQIIDITGQLLIDMREEREQRADDELREQYREEGRALAHEELRKQRSATRRRRSSRPTKATAARDS